jgi:hypothetical protein
LKAPRQGEKVRMQEAFVAHIENMTQTAAFAAPGSARKLSKS